MALTFDRVHRYTRVPGTLEMRLVETTPYVRLRAGDDPPLYVQSGVVYDEGGNVIDELPAWFGEQVQKLSPVVRAEVGLALPGQSASQSAESAPARATPRKKRVAEPWTCECGWQGTTLGKQFHRINAHKERKEPTA